MADGFSVHFDEVGDFAAVDAAERALSLAGFSVGRSQRGAPRGILFGDYDIQKWRNLRTGEREALHGQMLGGRNGPVTVTLFADAPQAARDAFAHLHVSSAPGALPTDKAIEHLTRVYAEDAVSA
jgi:hypothetical protein